MENQTLEQEFETYKALHKYAVLKAKIMSYYRDLNDSSSNHIPSFLLQEEFEKQADEDLRTLITLPDGLQKFNRLYQIAWDSMAELMD